MVNAPTAVTLRDAELNHRDVSMIIRLRRRYLSRSIGLDIRIIIAFSMAVSLGACMGAGRLSPNVGELITVSQALRDIGKGLSGMNQELGDLTIRLFACRVLVTLNVAVSATSEAGIAIASPAEIEISSGAVRAESWGNTVEVAM